MKKKLMLLLTLLLGGNIAYSQTIRQSLYEDADLFTDLSYSELRPGIKGKEIKKIKNESLRKAAEQMYEGKYDKTYRAAFYHAYPSISELRNTIKLGAGFSQYENMTGMYLSAGENIVLVGNTNGKQISLLAPFLTRRPGPDVKEPSQDPLGWGLHKQEYLLTEGVNIITIEQPGNVYIKYFDDHTATAPTIRVHFLTGKVNGYFDASRGDTNETWNSLLDNAVSEIMDVRSNYLQVAYPVKWFKTFTYNKGVELARVYDEMLHNHYTVQGLVKHNKIPRNRLFARVNYNYYMFKDGDGVAYYGDSTTMRMVMTPEEVVRDGWGFAHEAGHALAMNEMMWGGMIEVANNIMSMYSTLKFNNPNPLLARGHYDKARKSIIDKKVSYLSDPDVFNRLVPFWQLHCYFTQNGQPDFFADLMEAFRLEPYNDKIEETYAGNNSILRQFNFMKKACDVSKTDLTDFFVAWGFFWTGKLQVDDYGLYNYDITQQMVDETKQYIKSKNYPHPKMDITQLK